MRMSFLHPGSDALAFTSAAHPVVDPTFIAWTLALVAAAVAWLVVRAVDVLTDDPDAD